MNKMKSLLKNTMIAFSFQFLAFSSFAAVDGALVASAETYLNSITGLTGDFTQVSGGKTDFGTFSMLRPGKVRLDYKKAPVQLISDGKDLYFFDKSLDQITTIPITSTPAGILVREKINLRNADIVVSDTSAADKTFSLKIHIKGQEGAGNMNVVFDKNPVKLNSWIVTDATGAKTEIRFGELKTKTDFDKNYFQLQRHKTVSKSKDKYYK